MIPVRVLEQFDQESRRVRRHLGVPRKGGEEVPIGCFWAPHGSFLALNVTAGVRWFARLRLTALFRMDNDLTSGLLTWA
jgi:hypothetical protein